MDTVPEPRLYEKFKVTFNVKILRVNNEDATSEGQVGNKSQQIGKELA